MFSKNSSSGDYNGFLLAGSHINGELQFEDTFRIDGRLTGSIVSDGELIVGERGEVDGEIKVRRVYVSGIVHGKVNAGEYLEIADKGRVFADITTPALKIEEGAVFEGRCSMGADRSKKETSGKDATPSNVTQLPLAQKSGS